MISIPPRGKAVQFNLTVSNLVSLNATLQLQTFITGFVNGYLVLTLIAPNGARATLSSGYGGAFLSVFNGTVWVDSSLNFVGSTIFVAGFTAPVLRPVGSLDSLAGDGK